MVVFQAFWVLSSVVIAVGSDAFAAGFSFHAFLCLSFKHREIQVWTILVFVGWFMWPSIVKFLGQLFLRFLVC